MAKFELNIYGGDDTVLKQYATDHIPYGVFMRALEIDDSFEGKTPREQITLVNEIVKTVFNGLTDEELMQADIGDVFATFRQVLAQTGNIKGSKNSKN